MHTYQTITKDSESLFKEKGSRFIGYAFHVENETAIALRIEQVKLLHPKATHHCYAYKVGLEDVKYKANDDGEPSNSAGKPILGQIESHKLSNTLIIVVRYYGGTKLGVGGLQTAYKEAAYLAITSNHIIEKEIPVFYQITFPYDKQGIVDHLLKTINGQVIQKEFTQDCFYECEIPKATAEKLLKKLTSDPSISIKES